MRADLPLLGVTWGDCAAPPGFLGRLSDDSSIGIGHRADCRDLRRARGCASRPGAALPVHPAAIAARTVSGPDKPQGHRLFIATICHRPPLWTCLWARVKALVVCKETT
jgi:hypothetical protein